MGTWDDLKNTAQKVQSAAKNAVKVVKNGTDADGDSHHGTANNNSTQRQKFDDIYSPEHQRGEHNDE